MRIQYLSDLHLESHAFTLKHEPTADVVVLAGDITTYRSLHRFDNILRTACEKPVIYVTGNHEFYLSRMSEMRKLLKAFSKTYPNFHYLDNEWVDIEGVRFAGTPLYSDFNLYGNQEVSMMHAQAGISDFHCVINDDVETRLRVVTPSDYAHWHRQARDFIKLAKTSYAGNVVVVTHFCPARGSISERWRGSSLNPFFTSDCSDLMGDNLKVWIHGHTHDSCDYVENGTHVVCNPRGYTSVENTAFKSTKIVEV